MRTGPKGEDFGEHGVVVVVVGGGFLRARSGAGRGDWHTGKRAGRKREGKGKAGVLGKGGWVY